MTKMCCISAKTATIIIGIQGLIISFLAVVALIFVSLVALIGPIDMIYYVLFFYLFISNILNLMFSPLLIAAAVNIRHRMFVPWLVFSGTSIAFYAFLMIISPIFVDRLYNDYELLIPLYLFFVLLCQIWAFVYKFYKNVREQKHEYLIEEPTIPLPTL